MTLDGIDVSYANASTPSLGGCAFAFARATYGTSADSMYVQHTADFRKAGIVIGAYAFGVNGDGAAQAKAFLAIAHTADLLALDVEKEPGRAGMTGNQARDFITTVHAAGFRIGLYHSDSAFPTLGQDWNWVAKWGSVPPTRRWAFWQWTGTSVDRDRFNGTAQALQLLVGKVAAPDTLMPMYLVHLRPGTLTLKAGTTVHGYAPKADGAGWEVVRTWGPKQSDATARFDTNLERLSGITTPSALLHVVGGYFVDLYISTAEVDETFDTAPTTGG